MSATLRFACCLTTCLILAGCIGTDYIDDPVSPSAASLVIMPSTLALQPGMSMQLGAFVVEGGSSVPTSGVIWSSTDTGLVAVDGVGVVSARRVGQARIVAQAGSLTSDAALITVVADQNQVARVEILPRSVQRRPGESQQFNAVAYNLNNEVVNGRPVNWSSSVTAIASINANGLAIAQAVGTASIVATIDGVEGLPAVFTVTSSARAGMFVTRPGSGHPVQGTATLAQGSNGALGLSFGSDFSSAGGPDVRVYLSTTNTVGANSISLGSLARLSGAQSYAVPSSVQLNTYDWVIIHCVPFNITFGYARLQ